jgi:hypothetical protein
VLVILLYVLGGLGISRAQSTVIDEHEFWSRMDETNILLQKAISQSGEGRAATVEQVRGLWRGVSSVKLSDGMVMAVDMTWLTSISDGESDANLREWQSRVQAILDYHASQVPGKSDPRQALNTLDKVLKDPRFNYPPATPTPIPKQQEPSSDRGLSAGIGQFILIIGGMVSVILLGWYLLRGMQVKQAALAAQSNGEDPATSQDARELAAGSQAASDYRSAIRYLYLSSLLLLDERGVIHYDRTLTNREHLRQVADKPGVSEALRPVVNTFDRVWYGIATVDEAMYQEFQADVERLRGITP